MSQHQADQKKRKKQVATCHFEWWRTEIELEKGICWTFICWMQDEI